ncbi:hypothetical protein ACFO3D_14380 [Virgibacillus kekensis]|uniref:Uncharacterized protein n=1 Tax=Virgibacillus kekensis TaxID=202261 RepID=A0ABV9DKM0_9BACI
MISEPVSKRCDNRKMQAPQHPNTTDASEWFSIKYLPNGYYTLSFDFFVNWRTYQISNEIWLKRIVNHNSYSSWPTTNKTTVQSALDQCEGKNTLKRIGSFASKRNLRAIYHIFKDSINWVDYPASFISTEINSKGNIARITKNDLGFIKDEIIRLSGKKIYVGQKGLSYSSTALECYLANQKTGATWPGDVDAILFNKDDEPISIIEYKKNTIHPRKSYHTPIIKEGLSNFYSPTKWAKDNSKYNRLSIFRDYIGDKELPIIIVYYPSWESDKPEKNIIKLEEIGGKVNSLKTIQEKTLAVPYTTKDKKSLVATLLNMV